MSNIEYQTQLDIRFECWIEFQIGYSTFDLNVGFEYQTRYSTFDLNVGFSLIFDIQHST